MTSVMALGADGAPAGQRGPQAFGGGRGMQRGQQDMNAFAARVINAVGADEEQAKQLKAIAEEYNTAATNAREKMAALSDADRTKVRELHQKVREARRSGDDAAVADLQKEIHEITGSEPVPSPQDTYDRMADVLTDDQLPAFEELVQAQGNMRKGRSGPGMRGRGGRGGPEIMLQRFVDKVAVEVNATDDQRAQFQDILKQHQAEAQAEREKMDAARDEHREELQDLRSQMREAIADGDEAKIADLRQQMSKLMGARQRNQMINDVLAAIGDVLTDEQKPAYEGLVAEMKERLAATSRGVRGPRPEGRGPGRGGPHGRRGIPVEGNNADDK
ncbi:MAG TPA: Spy/CpxP family protein refolding chaperone [Phycisphaerae bacterium]|nr:Spy/CpxP family protein refolding chaperone [Phycisphaerae bacterium]